MPASVIASQQPAFRGGGGGSGAFAVSGTLTNGKWQDAYSGSLSASGGTAPYTVSGLPYGLSAGIVGGSITISGTPS